MNKRLILLSFLLVIISISGCVRQQGTTPTTTTIAPPTTTTTPPTTTTTPPTTTTTPPTTTTTTSTTTTSATTTTQPTTTTSTTTTAPKETTTTTIPEAIGNLTVHFIDVGQGDSILVEMPDNKTVLVDGGDNNKGYTVESYLKSLNIDRIDVVIATHPHADHIGGLDYVMGVFSVNKVWDNGQEYTTQTYKDYINVAKQKNYQIVNRDYSFTLDTIKLKVLSPPKPFVTTDLNDNSVVVKVSYGNIDFLLTGDCEEACEQNVLDSGVGVGSEILKVGHHGSNTATSSNFLTSVNPDVAVISVGAGNTYGHPHQVTLDKLADKGVKVYRTDLQGDIVITTDGMSYSAVTEK